MRPCTRCGKCCENYGDGLLGSATEADLQRLENRPDVLRYLDALGDFWISPITHDDMHRCPWLRKLPNQATFKCRIHDVRPDICRNYPVSIDQMIKDGCEMLEEADLEKPRDQLERELRELRNK